MWEAVYLLDGLLRNKSDLQPSEIHADTQGQSLPVFGLAHLLGFELLPRIRNWQDLIFYRPDRAARYEHVDSLFSAEAVDWQLIETHWDDLMRVALSVRAGRISSVTLLRRLGNESKRNRIYRALREVGRAVRTIVLLRFLSEPELRDSIAAVTNRVEAFHGFANWLSFGREVLAHNDPVHQEMIVKFNELMANCAIYSTALDIMVAANELFAAGSYPLKSVWRASLTLPPSDPLATVRRYVELQRNFLRNPLPPSPGICPVCRGVKGDGFAICYRCQSHRERSAGLLADLVVPISYSPRTGQHHYNLRAYKSSPPSRQAQWNLLALLLLFLREHLPCISHSRTRSSKPVHEPSLQSCLAVMSTRIINSRRRCWRRSAIPCSILHAVRWTTFSEPFLRLDRQISNCSQDGVSYCDHDENGSMALVRLNSVSRC